MREEEEAKRRAKEEAEIARKTQQEAIRRAEEAAARQAEEVALKAQEEAKLQAQEEAKRKAREEEDAKRRQQMKKEKRTRLEAEDVRLSLQKTLELDQPEVCWWYFKQGEGCKWYRFPSDLESRLELALMESVQSLKLQSIGLRGVVGDLDVHVSKMYAVDRANQCFPVKRMYGDEPTIESTETARSEPPVVWSSLNPLNQKLERFPMLVSRVLELKRALGHPSASVLIHGQLEFDIVFQDMKQVNQVGHFRHVVRTEQIPSWECFNPNAARGPMWEVMPSEVSACLEDCFAAGEQSAEVITRNGQVAHVELRNMLTRVGDRALGLRRQLCDVDKGAARKGQGYKSTTSNGAPAPSPRRAIPANPHSARPPNARLYVEVYDISHDKVDQIMRHRPVQTVPLPPGKRMIGREPTAGGVEIRGAGMSRHHCTVELTPVGELHVCDLGSTLGTFVWVPPNGYQKLPPHHSCSVPLGACLALGKTVVRVVEIF
uniref:FHA domain-containing protein n=1 Tax=Eutreptiella gymnastica TaxID=73025 RepID=A0A7S1J9N1_9EUGL